MFSLDFTKALYVGKEFRFKDQKDKIYYISEITTYDGHPNVRLGYEYVKDGLRVDNMIDIYYSTYHNDYYIHTTQTLTRSFIKMVNYIMEVMHESV